MSDFERFSEELRQQMHAAVDDLHPSPKLVANVDAIPSGRGAIGLLGRLGRNPRRIALALPVPIAAIIVAAMALFGGSGVVTSYADAFRVLPNGDIRVTISELVKVTAANRELREHHISSIVVRPMSDSCPERPSMTYITTTLIPAPKITLTPRTIERGWTTVLADTQTGPNKIVEAIGRFKGRVPKCVSLHGPGPRV
jgi:hypothetical protein